jgi:hypothetical protein
MLLHFYKDRGETPFRVGMIASENSLNEITQAWTKPLWMNVGYHAR